MAQANVSHADKERSLKSVVAFEPRRFESAASYYLEGRPSYASKLIQRVARLLGLDRTQRLLDLGTGPGLLAVAFAPYVMEVIAIDPEPEMLRIADEYAAHAGVRIGLREGSSYSLDETLGQFDLVTIGRAFHWMDRQATLEALDKLVQPGGAVTLFATRHPGLPENGWTKDYDALRGMFSEASSSRVTWRPPDWVAHEEILLDSPFSDLERISIIERRITPLEHFITRALSLSTSSPGRIGESAEELARVLRAVLAKYSKNGVIQEVVESEVLIAFRPAKIGVK